MYTWGSRWITGKEVRNSSFWIHTWQCSIAQGNAYLQCLISFLSAAFPGIILLCSRIDDGLTVCSVSWEIQPSLVLDTPKTLAWSFAVAGARGKCLLHTFLQPVPRCGALCHCWWPMRSWLETWCCFLLVVPGSWTVFIKKEIKYNKSASSCLWVPQDVVHLWLGQQGSGAQR